MFYFEIQIGDKVSSGVITVDKEMICQGSFIHYINLISIITV